MLVPAHDLALSIHLSCGVGQQELDRGQALQFLRKQEPALPDTAPNGWLLMQHGGRGLGWGKNLGRRVNNYLPKGW